MNGMNVTLSKLTRILPKTIENAYNGSPLAKHTFLVITMVTIVRSLIHIFAADGGAQSIATMPLDSYTPAGAAAVITMFSLWGLSQLLMGLVYVVVYLRYTSLIPAMYVLLISEYTLRIVIGIMKPIVTGGTVPGSIGNFVLVPLCVIMLALSLRRGKEYTY